MLRGGKKISYLLCTTLEFWKLLLINSFIFFISRSGSLLFRACIHIYAANLVLLDTSGLSTGKSPHTNSKFYSEGFIGLKSLASLWGVRSSWISQFSQGQEKNPDSFYPSDSSCIWEILRGQIWSGSRAYPECRIGCLSRVSKGNIVVMRTDLWVSTELNQQRRGRKWQNWDSVSDYYFLGAERCFIYII